MNPAYNTRSGKRWLPSIVLVLFLITVARIGFAIYTRTTTGTLHITTKEPNAVVSISQQNKKAAFLGKGDVSVRLKPGVYLVSATLAGDLATSSVNITAGKITSKQVNPVHVTPPASATALTGFINFDTLVDNGLSSEHLSAVKGFFSDFAPNAQIVSIDPTSINLNPREPGVSYFEMDFNLSIDSVPYHGIVRYIIFGEASLEITDTTGKRVFASGIEAPEAD